MLSRTSVNWCLVVLCWERVDLFTLIHGVLLWTFPWSSMVLDCIDSWSLPSFLLSVLSPWFVMHYLVSFLVLQSSWRGRESYLLHCYCLPDALRLLVVCGSSSWVYLQCLIVVFTDHTRIRFGRSSQIYFKTMMMTSIMRGSRKFCQRLSNSGIFVVVFVDEGRDRIQIPL